MKHARRPCARWILHAFEEPHSCPFRLENGKSRNCERVCAKVKSISASRLAQTLNKLPLPLLIPAFKSFHQFGWPKLLPINRTVSVTCTCASRSKPATSGRKKSIIPARRYERIPLDGRRPDLGHGLRRRPVCPCDLPEIFGLIPGTAPEDHQFCR